MNKWKVNILTLFTQIFPGPLTYSVVGNALTSGLWSLIAHNIRDYATTNYKQVDDLPYGGGSGMILCADVLGTAIERVFLSEDDIAACPIICLSPRGQLFNHNIAKELSRGPGINLICGRFEGVDERLIKHYNVLELSVGDYVLSSGDVAAFSVIDACVRLLEGVVGCADSLEEESFCIDGGLLEYPHYTRPRIWKDMAVPDVLLSGHHEKIRAWRLDQAKGKTKEARPDLWEKYMKLSKV